MITTVHSQHQWQLFLLPLGQQALLTFPCQCCFLGKVLVPQQQPQFNARVTTPLQPPVVLSSNQIVKDKDV
eukprot:1040913-Ditylum_brightwellii.AAC.1